MCGCSWKAGKDSARERRQRPDRVKGQEGKLLRDRFGPMVRLSGGKGMTREEAASHRGGNVRKGLGVASRGSGIT